MKEKTNVRDQPLEAIIVDGRLEISIGLDCLCFAVSHHDGWPENYKITSNDGFAEEILDELLREAEDGTTLLHIAIDGAAREALEMGAIHIEEMEGEKP